MEILQARIVEWFAIPSFRGSSQPMDRTQVSWIAGRLFTVWATREALKTQNSPSVPYLAQPTHSGSLSSTSSSYLFSFSHLCNSTSSISSCLDFAGLLTGFPVFSITAAPPATTAVHLRSSVNVIYLKQIRSGCSPTWLLTNFYCLENEDQT